MINKKAVFSAAFFIGLLAVALPNLWAAEKKSGAKSQSKSLNRLDSFGTMDAFRENFGPEACIVFGDRSTTWGIASDDSIYVSPSRGYEGVCPLN